MTQYLLAAIPLLLLGTIVTLVVRTALRNRIPVKRSPRPARAPKAKKVHLRVVSPDQMDADLQDLIRKS